MDAPITDDFPPTLPIEQLCSIHVSNEYVERPAISCQQTLSSSSLAQQAHKSDWSLSTIPSDLPRSLSQCHQLQLLPQHLSQPSLASSISHTTITSDQRLLTSITPSPSDHSLICTQPQAGALKVEESQKGAAEKLSLHTGGHLFICEECGRCKCIRCTATRTLPSCWLCKQRCLCSPESLLDYSTCLCCVKGIFYHCSTDDEDNCADEPCSCGPGSCCARWAAMSLLSLVMPCLCLYPPARGCLKLCQQGYDGLRRPGCRCKSHTNTVCRKISSSSGAAFPRAMEKPV
ncbi:protein sprouty homolog 3 [Vombatus ursinus]|uniref:Sprouty RTK signaling antagonist 3 n=1 Tax=Vombatus ursinus TaxID=29139 RepID=A0A4X2M2L0_VOMUR|nr:protein sprouty homolog 3 [Vombatus ursinus]